MIAILTRSSGFFRTLLRMIAGAYFSVSSKFLIREKAVDAQDWKHRRAETLWKEAVDLQSSGLFKKSLAKWLDSAKFEADSSDPRLDFLAHVYNEIGYCNYQTLNYQESRRYYELALDTYKKISIFHGANSAYTMNNFALLLLEIGEETRAAQHVLDALKILEKKTGKNSPLLTYVLNNLARIRIHQKRYSEGEQVLLRALDVENKMMVGGSPEVVTTLELLAIVSFHLKKIDQSEGYFLKVVEMREQARGFDHKSVAPALYSLGGFYADVGNYEKAEQAFYRCRDILSINYGPDHRFSGVFLNQLGWVAVQKQRLNEARSLFDRAVEIGERYGNKHRIDLAVSLYNSGLLDWMQNSDELAGQKLFRSLALFSSISNKAYLPIIHYGVCVLLDQKGRIELSLFFGKLSLRDSLRRRGSGAAKTVFPRWLLYPPNNIVSVMKSLFERSGRQLEAEAFFGSGSASAVSRFFSKESKSAMKWNRDEQVWADGYEKWSKQARIWGENQDRPEQEPDEAAVARAGYQSLNEVVEGFASLLESFESRSASA
ncbi:MAG: tetratricopeptide repeat protein [Magnetococcales bacterium]|nr:tetratricopeptide repeat protein [Magnetococcales bacterium]